MSTIEAAAQDTARRMMERLEFEQEKQQEPEDVPSPRLDLYFYILGREDHHPQRDGDAELEALTKLLLTLAATGKVQMEIPIYGDQDCYVQGPNIAWLGGLYQQMGFLERVWGRWFHFTDVVRHPSRNETSRATFTITKT